MINALSRRAALRRRSLQDYRTPETTGPTEAADRASLIFTGAPEGEAASAATRFGPRGFKLAKDVTETTGQYAMRVLKPIVSAAGKKAKSYRDAVRAVVR